VTAGHSIGTNHVAEWFGHRTYPVVAATDRAKSDQVEGRCPFLSDATGQDRSCVKSDNSKGVCTVSSVSRDPERGRQDWLVCPIRSLDLDLIDDVVRRLFGHTAETTVEIVPAPVLAESDRRDAFRAAVLAGTPAIVYFQTKLGGEITLSPTPKSPEFSFDATMVEVLPDGQGGLVLGRYGIFEIQTMDYHGTYRHAVQNLRDGLRLHPDDFHETLRTRPDWLSDRMEGPNISNVFKRTFYQMMFKFQIGAHEHSAGCVFAIPRPVWDSWQRHLAAPDLVQRSDGAWQLGQSDPGLSSVKPPAWIYVLDLDVSDEISPNGLRVWRVIATDAQSMSHYALDLAPAAALEEGGSVDRLMATVRARLGTFLPELLMSQQPERRGT
jgi:hypothetical protein